MPSLSNCVIPGCTFVSGNKGKANTNWTYILRFNPYARYNKAWHEKLLEFCSKYHDKKMLIDSTKKGQAGICERHFRDEDFYNAGGRKRLLRGTMPTQNLPDKSTDEVSSLPKKQFPNQEHYNMPIRHGTLDDVQKSFLELKKMKWYINRNFYTFQLSRYKSTDICDLPIVTLKVGTDLSIEFKCHGMLLEWNGPDLKTSTISEVLHHAESFVQLTDHTLEDEVIKT